MNIRSKVTDARYRLTREEAETIFFMEDTDISGDNAHRRFLQDDGASRPG